MNKKAALNLGISTIVVLVIAMVVIAAGVSFIRTFFRAGEESLLNVFHGVEGIGVEPTRSNPIVFDPGTISVKSGDSAIFRVGVYNDRETALVNATLGMVSCTDNLRPRLEALNTTIDPGRAATFTVRIETENTYPDKNDVGEEIVRNPPPKTYICRIAAQAQDINNIHSRDLTLEITS